MRKRNGSYYWKRHVGPGRRGGGGLQICCDPGTIYVCRVMDDVREGRAAPATVQLLFLLV